MWGWNRTHLAVGFNHSKNGSKKIIVCCIQLYSFGKCLLDLQKKAYTQGTGCVLCSLLLSNKHQIQNMHVRQHHIGHLTWLIGRISSEKCDYLLQDSQLIPQPYSKELQHVLPTMCAAFNLTPELFSS